MIAGKDIRAGDLLIIDGQTGMVIPAPTDASDIISVFHLAPENDAVGGTA